MKHTSTRSTRRWPEGQRIRRRYFCTRAAGNPIHVSLEVVHAPHQRHACHACLRRVARALAGSLGPDAGRPTIRPKFFFPQNLIRPTRGRQPLVLPGGTTQDITGPTRRLTYVRGVRLATCTSTTLCRL